MVGLLALTIVVVLWLLVFYADEQNPEIKEYDPHEHRRPVRRLRDEED